MLASRCSGAPKASWIRASGGGEASGCVPAAPAQAAAAHRPMEPTALQKDYPFDKSGVR